MKQAIFVMLDEYADWEGAYLSSQLNQSSDWEIKTASTTAEVTSIGGIRTKITDKIADIPSDCELLILIGGNSWTIKNDQLKEVIARRLITGKSVAAICGAVDYLAENGLLTGYKHTGNAQYLWQNFAEYKNGTDFVSEDAVCCRNLVTANGTAPLKFTEQVLQMIKFKDNEQVTRDIDLYRLGFYKYCEKYGNPFV
ncbi:DJ-1/PfpI family protein [Lactobacillus sp. ESL0679]|uniref:DJ-1/PfpI family protein n=1 Tax=Lactobacillus sp. ESL0679 TaxID=2983209 RepID=UPI0023F6AF82|nr:DJ-1/PfpI family protein [Lactobacillus sp. ESL0679]MDF7683101.1 DJ-1/PfpI family protein [Lactobacillus sp. ESL0679]